MNGKGIPVGIWAIGCLYILVASPGLPLSYIGRDCLVNLIGLTM